MFLCVNVIVSNRASHITRSEKGKGKKKDKKRKVYVSDRQGGAKAAGKREQAGSRSTAKTQSTQKSSKGSSRKGQKTDRKAQIYSFA